MLLLPVSGRYFEESRLFDACPARCPATFHSLEETLCCVPHPPLQVTNRLEMCLEEAVANQEAISLAWIEETHRRCCFLLCLCIHEADKDPIIPRPRIEALLSLILPGMFNAALLLLFSLR